MQDYLVFRLHGPMASWGQAAVGGDRHSGQQPTRSAVIGLLSAALGITRDDSAQLGLLGQQVRIAVKQYTAGSLLRDYHTAQMPSQKKGAVWATRKSELQAEKLNTVLSNRDYRCDGLWVVAVSLVGDGPFKLEQLQLALLKPTFLLYLGRKSCPLAAPLQPNVLKAHDLKHALDTVFLPMLADASEQYWLEVGGTVTYFWEGELSSFPAVKRGVFTTRPWDDPVDRKRWQFAQRELHQITLQESI